jgi:hypothetical protein
MKWTLEICDEIDIGTISKNQKYSLGVKGGPIIFSILKVNL